MIWFLQGRVSGRRGRLITCACCRKLWGGTTGGPAGRAIALGEEWADGGHNPEEAWAAWDDLYDAATEAYSAGDLDGSIRFHDTSACLNPDPLGRLVGGAPTVGEKIWGFGRDVADWFRLGVMYRKRRPGPVSWCTLIRDIAGSPFRPVTLDPSWLTSTVVSLARRMYDTRDFSPMPILADALLDAGCDNADILDHCRGDGPHVRGCWVVDLVLGKG
jgi:hypothetical protein